MATKKIIAEELCNTSNLIDLYPIVYSAAWNILYKGELTKKIQFQVNQLQSDDTRRLGYIPTEIFIKLKAIL